jgi:hypothetical protein
VVVVIGRGANGGGAFFLFSSSFSLFLQAKTKQKQSTIQ